MALWGVRAGRNGETEDLDLESGMVAVDWREIPDLRAFATRDDLVERCRTAYSNERPNTITNWAGQLWAFRERMQIGELVILPRRRPGASGTVAIGRITGPYVFRADLPPEAYHTRAVEWLRKDVPRASLDQDIQFSLGALMTIFQVQRERAEERIATGVLGQKPPVAHPPTPGTVDVPTDVEAPTDLDTYARDRIRTYIGQKFRGHDLSRLVEAILNAQGYRTLNSPPGPDGGIDIIAGTGPLGFDAPRMCVQVKSTAQATDVRPMRELQGVLNSFGAQQALFISWGGYTPPALAFARQHFFTMRIWDADSLIDALFANYERLSPDLQAELPLKRIWTLVLEE